ncbi:hypothetical protein HELRODRAFT_163180 [Helobdella robusta]|uniref:Uncharacterized protein n=1 Tax=Helobdella robusta TaxID=6412 RepID=T1ETR8_HELRO|nr:hypothetical protein HELRODRAFT_163180 [Helobdella robusta]ESN96148.1 hypothetical protein HELRODRAFT_163180 [Helobdella robusta]
MTDNSSHNNTSYNYNSNNDNRYKTKRENNNNDTKRDESSGINDNNLTVLRRLKRDDKSDLVENFVKNISEPNNIPNGSYWTYIVAVISCLIIFMGLFVSDYYYCYYYYFLLFPTKTPKCSIVLIYIFFIDKSFLEPQLNDAKNLGSQRTDELTRVEGYVENMIFYQALVNKPKNAKIIVSENNVRKEFDKNEQKKGPWSVSSTIKFGNKKASKHSKTSKTTTNTFTSVFVNGSVSHKANNLKIFHQNVADSENFKTNFIDKCQKWDCAK